MINLPSGIKVNDLLDDFKVLSWEVSETLLYYAQMLQNSNDEIEILKNDNIDDPVTLADLKVNEIVIKRINEKYSNIPWQIISEENVKISSENFDIKSDWVWILDPLDGTKDFIQGTGNYAMHLALNYKNKPYLGFVLIPDKDELWISDGEKSWCEKKDGTKFNSKISINKSMQEMILVTSKNHNNETLRNLIQKIEFNKVVIMGSIGCKIASLLRGESDIYICLSLPGKSAPKDWDFAAPAAILKASGGSITNLYNEELSYSKSNFEQGGIIVATRNKSTHNHVCNKIKEIVKEYDLYPLRP